MSYIGDILSELEEINSNNNYQWDVLGATFQGNLREHVDSSFWQEYIQVTTNFQKALEELDNHVTSILNRLPCD